MGNSSLLSERKLELIEVIASLQDAKLVDRLLDLVRGSERTAVIDDTPPEHLAIIRARLELARNGEGTELDEYLKELDAYEI